MIPARVIEQHKSIVSVATESETLNLPLIPKMPPLIVGDWVLLDDSRHFYRLLDRKTCFRRKAAGLEANWQLIAANVDTAFIVSSLNDDFNLSRIERYLALTNAATVEPVILLTKSDLVEHSEHWLEQVYKLDRALSVIALNALDPQCAERLSDWLGLGKTVVFLGSSGVGKSTLTNTLLGQDLQSTGGIREDDSKGRQTTTSRSLVSLPNGGMVLDTPGMRELQIADCQDGIASTFADIQNLAARCSFADCTHNSEPGCAVQKAVQAGEIDSRRLRNYQKLLKGEALGKFYKRTLAEAHKIKGQQ